MSEPTVTKKASPIKKKPVPEVVSITDDDDDVKMISEKMSTEKLPSKTKKVTINENQASSSIRKDISQESLVKKLQENKIQDSDEESKPISTQKKRLRKICDESDEEQPKKLLVKNQPQTQAPAQAKGKNPKKSAKFFDEISDDDDLNNELDIGSSDAKMVDVNQQENKNIIGNLLKTQMGAKVTAPVEQSNKQADPNAPKPKGRKKVKKTREVIVDGYTEFQDYTSFEEYDLPDYTAQTQKVAPPKKIVANLTGTQQPQASKAKGQSSLAAFFAKK